MFSDIEGCQKFNLAGSISGGILQSGFLCNPVFYAEIKRRLVSDPNLNIAFLGDYFDQGMGVYESINGMDRLLTEFNKDGKERVFVILGNRDVNKLRFCFELAKKGIVGLGKGERWEFGFGEFYDNLNDKTDVALANCILYYSMGARIDMDTNNMNKESDAKLIGLHSFIPPGKNINDSKLALKYLKVSLGIEPRVGYEDALNLLGFFKKCKIAHVFDQGTLGKVLLAHGGGFDPDAFFGQAYVDSFGVEEITPQNYHSTLEQFRRKLSGDVQKGGAFDRAAAIEYGNTASKENMKRFRRAIEKVKPSVAGAIVDPSVAEAIVKPVDMPMPPEIMKDSNFEPSLVDTQTAQTAVELSVNAYNKLLDDVLSEISGDNPVFTWKFVLLQALGLKPDGDTNNKDARYKSLIQSCSQDGCAGPNNKLSNDVDSSKLAKILTDSGITHVSYGHKPHCFPIPVIYQREEVPGVTFISNDTSNGNRKVEEIGENTAIGTMVIFERQEGGGGVKTKIEPVDLDSEKREKAREKGENVPYERKVGDYSAMYTPLTLATTPVYKPDDSDANVLEYGDVKNVNGKGTVVFNNLLKPPALFGQLNFKVEKNPVEQGGKRRSRNRKRNTKRGSKHVSKRTKRNKRHVKRSRKMRKY